MSVVEIILATIFYFLEEPAFIPTVIGVCVNFIFMAILIKTQRYEFVAILFIITGPLISIYTLNAIDDRLHFVDPVWMLIIALYAYFTIGKIAGNISILVQFAGIIYYLLFNLENNLLELKELTKPEIYSLSFNIASCGLVLSYIIHQFIKRNSFAVQQYKDVAMELQNKNIIVQKQNIEKTAMLKEIHHRVKNNLQVITSLLRLQSREIDNLEIQAHFQEAINRIATMSLIHNKMYQANDLSQIDIKSYFQTLSEDLIQSYAIHKKIHLNLNIAVENILPNTLVPLALIYNELFSNSLKHAFKDNEEGTITFEILHQESSFYMNYSDNGTWLAPLKSETFGLELIDTLAQQLNGNVNRTTENGTHFKIKFENS